MKNVCIRIIISLITLLVLPVLSAANQNTIEQLTREIAAERSEQQKSRLLLFRARNHNRLGNIQLAEEDYDAALAYDHKGWIHLERSRFFIAHGNYIQAKKEAVAAQKETPTLKGESQKLVAIAEKKIKKERKLEKMANDPEVILLTKRWEVRSSPASPTNSAARDNVRQSYAKRNKERAKKRVASRPRRAARS